MKRIRIIFSTKGWIKTAIRMLKLGAEVFSMAFKKHIYVFGAPDHSNLGDHAQSYCIERWCRINYPDHDVRIFTQFGSALERCFIWFLSEIANPEDIIICHSGYHMTEMYPLYETYIRVAKRFRKNRVVVFPQTVNFQAERESDRVARTFDNRENCLFICRDRKSYESAQSMFNSTPLVLFPDIVTSLIGQRSYMEGRSGVLFCIRNDKESHYNKSDLVSLIDRIDDQVEITDTTLAVQPKDIIDNREYFVWSEIEKYSKFSVVVTDRYHGTIFSLAAGTPVIVLGSSDHKLETGVEWFGDEVFDEYVFFVRNLDECLERVEHCLRNVDSISHELPPVFNETYYGKLKAIIEERTS